MEQDIDCGEKVHVICFVERRQQTHCPDPYCFIDSGNLLDGYDRKKHQRPLHFKCLIGEKYLCERHGKKELAT